MKLKAKAWAYGIIAIVLVVALNLTVLALLNFPPMATSIIKKYFIFLILLIGGFGLQVGLFTYFNGLNALSCSTTIASGGISSMSMILCCSHYILNILPFLGAIIGISALASLSKYTAHFIILGIFSNIVGIGIIGYQAKKYKDEK